MAKRLLILGGYGNTGRLIAECLLQETDVALVLAGRSLERASALAAELDSRCEVPRVAAIMDHVEQVADAALKTGIDYVDTQLSAPPKLDALRWRYPSE